MINFKKGKYFIAPNRLNKPHFCEINILASFVIEEDGMEDCYQPNRFSSKRMFQRLY